jgi:hypothetical protein
MSIIEQVKELLKGIDQQEIDSENGWWETSTGAAFGAEKLRSLIALIESRTE